MLKEVRVCILQGDEQRCKNVKPYFHSFWRDLHVRSNVVCVDERMAVSYSNQIAKFESLHLTHPKSCGTITLGKYVFWPYMHRAILNKAANCKACTENGRNSKPVIPASKWHFLVSCSEPNEEI